MRTFRFGLIAALSGAFLAVAPLAGAGASTKGCDALRTLQDEIADLGDIADDPLQPTAKELEETYRGQAAAYHQAAKRAPKGLRSALEALGDSYEAIGDDVYGSAATKFFTSKKYTRSLKKYRGYILRRC